MREDDQWYGLQLEGAILEDEGIVTDENWQYPLMGAKGLGIHDAMLGYGRSKGRPSTSKKNETHSEAIEIVRFMRKGWWWNTLLMFMPSESFCTDRQTARLGKRWCQDDDDDDVCKPKIHLKCRCPSLGRHTFKPLQLCKYEACVLPHCLWTGTQFPLGDDYYMLSISPSDDSFMPSLGVHELLSFLAECEQISV